MISAKLYCVAAYAQRCPKHSRNPAAVGVCVWNQEPCWPTDPYDFLVWWHCGYPASDTSCAKGWEKLNSEVGVEPRQLLAAGAARLARVLKAGGMVPELRAMRLMEIAARIQDEYGGDLRAGLAGPLSKVRQALKRFPNIADAGADRILLFGSRPSTTPELRGRGERPQPVPGAQPVVDIKASRGNSIRVPANEGRICRRPYLQYVSRRSCPAMVELKSATHKRLPASKFGLPKQRRYP